MAKCFRINRIISISFLVLIASALFGADLELYDYDDEDYRIVDKITQLAGVLGPSSSTPVTGSELKIALDRVDPSRLYGRYKAEYERLMDKFTADYDGYFSDAEVYIAPQVYLSANQETMNPKDYFIPFEDRLAAGYGALSFKFGENVFMESSLEAINNSVIKNDGKKGLPYTSFDFVMSNHSADGKWHAISTANQVQLYGEVPSMARGVIGNKWASLIVGRSRHRMGSGYSGNMVVGDNYRFQEIAKFVAASNPFTYTMDFTHFDIQDSTGAIGKPRFSGKQLLRLVHRFDFNVENRARIVANLGFLLCTENITDMRLITPLFVVHNWYNFRESEVISDGDEANNIMSVEIDWAIAPKWKMGFQLVVDQWQMFWEEDDVPDAFGILLNASYLQTIDKGDIEYYAEGVYTAPNLYLNTKYDDDAKTQKNYNYDFALGYFRRDTTGDLEWSGHKFGPNSLGIILGANASLYDYNLEVDSSISYYAHGDIAYDENYFTTKIYGWKGTPEHRFDIKSNATWGFTKSLELIGGVNLGFYWNFHHEKGSFKFMPQGMIGLKYTIL